MALLIRPNEFSPTDFSVVWRDPDGRELHVGRIFFNANTGGIPRPSWLWTVEYHQRKGRTEPHQGFAGDREAAMVAFKACWDSADVPIHWPPGWRLPE